MDINYYLNKVKAGRLKNTPKRRAVIGLFLKGNKYLGPREVRCVLKDQFSRLGLPSVYRILEELYRLGILIKVEKNRQLYYAFCRTPQSDHHHFVCKKCKKVEEVNYCNFKEISRFIEKELNGKVESHLLQIEGLCSNCR
jgi:Fur family ferric uptake transcriptional regulator